MAVVNRVLQFHSVSTLVLLSAVLCVIFLYETLLGYSRRLAVAVVSARLDAKLNLHVFNRLLRLPLDYFERNPAGETMYKLGQVHRIRAFLTGKLMTTLLDLITLVVLLPFLFILNATLAWIVLVCAVSITLIILAFLTPLKVLYSRINAAESGKSATLGRNHRRHPDRQVARPRAATACAMGRTRRRGGQEPAQFRQARQLAADPGHADRTHDEARHDDDRRLSRDGRSHPATWSAACSPS